MAHLPMYDFTLEDLEADSDYQAASFEDRQAASREFIAQNGADEALSRFDAIQSSEEFSILPPEEQDAFKSEYNSFYGLEDPVADPEEVDRTLLGTAGDVGISALKGAISIGEAIQGLIDIPTGGRFGYMTEKLGYRPSEAKDILETFYSDAQKVANKEVAETEGFVGTLKKMVEYPSTIVHSAVESLPLMGAGGVLGRGVVAAAPKVSTLVASAIGEGGIGAGLSAEQTRMQTDDKLLTPKQSAMAIASGIGTGAFNLVGGRIAKKAGFADFDTMLVEGGIGKTSAGIIKRVIAGGITEGAFEELPQSVQEQIWQNAALDKPLMEGVPEGAAQALLVGGLVGGGANLVTSNQAPTVEDLSASLETVDENATPEEITAHIENQTDSNLVTGGLGELAPHEQEVIDEIIPKINNASVEEIESFQSQLSVLQERNPNVANILAPIIEKKHAALIGDPNIAYDGTEDLMYDFVEGATDIQEGENLKLRKSKFAELQKEDDEKRADINARGKDWRKQEGISEAYKKAKNLPVEELSADQKAFMDEYVKEIKEVPESPKSIAKKEGVADVMSDFADQAIDAQEQEDKKLEGITREGDWRKQEEVSDIYKKTKNIKPAELTPDQKSFMVEYEKGNPLPGEKDESKTTQGKVQDIDAVGSDADRGKPDTTRTKRVEADTKETTGQPPIDEDIGTTGGATVSVEDKVEQSADSMSEELLSSEKGSTPAWLNSSAIGKYNKANGTSVKISKVGAIAVLKKVKAGKTLTAKQTEINNYLQSVATDKSKAPKKVENKDSVAVGQEINTDPSDAQKEAGNYKKGHVKLNGLDISIENPAGSTRSGKDESGKEWSVDLKNDYGYIKGSVGFDKDHVDVFVAPNYDGDGDVYVVNQHNKDGSFDEHKAVLGATSEKGAMATYNSNYEKGWDGGKSIVKMSQEDFKKWVMSDAPKKGKIGEPKDSKAEVVKDKQEVKFSVSGGKTTVASIEEDGKSFETGSPVTFKYAHNTDSATDFFGIPDKDSRYGRGYEPSGQYVTIIGDNATRNKLPNIVYGELTLNNPLVIENDNLNWKQSLSEDYGNKTGKELSKAIIADGYDGVITIDNGHTSEVLNLKNFDESIAKFSKSEGTPKNLIVTHNISEAGLKHASELGGLAAPSLAVTNLDVQELTGFGEISLIAKPEILNEGKVWTFDADIYSARQPQAEEVLDRKKTEELVNEINEAIDGTGLSFTGINSVRDLDDRSVFYAYLKEIGKAPSLKKVRMSPLARAVKDERLGGLMNSPKFINAVAKDLKSQLDKIAESDNSEQGKQVVEEISMDWFEMVPPKDYVLGKHDTGSGIGWAYSKDGDVVTAPAGSVTLARSRLNRKLRKDGIDQEFDYSKPREGQLRDAYTKVANSRQGIDREKLRDDLMTKDRSKTLRDGFEKWYTEKYDGLVKNKRLRKGYQKYSPYTLDNVVREMTRTLQGGETSNYGAASIRAVYSNQLKNKKAVQARRDSFTTKEEMSKIKDESNEKFFEIAEELKRYYKYDAESWGYGSALAEAITDQDFSVFKNRSEAKKIVDEFGQYLASLPTEYFEAKVQRAMDFSEFETALVPKGTKKETVDLLRSYGIKVKRYDADSDTGRIDALRNENKLLFSKTLSPENQANTTQELESALGKAGVRNLINKGLLEIVTPERASEILTEFDGTKSVKSKGVEGFTANGKTYLVDGNIAKGKALITLSHELGIHAQKLAFSDTKQFKSIQTMLERRSELDNAEGKAIRVAQKRVPKNTNPDHVAEETLAYLITNSPEIGVVRKFIADLKKFLIEKLGISPNILKNIDLQALSLAVVQREARSEIKSEVLKSEDEPMFQQRADSKIKTMFDKAIKTANFKNWFGDSKIVSKGKPHILYHGTNDANFLQNPDYSWKFETDRGVNQASSPLAELGIFLGDETIADAHSVGTEGVTHPFFVRIENPLYITSEELENKVYDHDSAKAFKKRQQDLNDHDGIIITDRGHAVAFESNQLKSVTDNTGEFSRTDDDVRYSVAEPETTPPFTSGKDKVYQAMEKVGLHNHWEDFIYNYVDKDYPRKLVQERGGKQEEKTDHLMAERLRGKKTTEEVERMKEELAIPLMKVLAKAKISSDDLGEFTHAMHAPERNLRMQQVNAKRHIDMIRKWLTTSEKEELDNELIMLRSDVLMSGGSLADRHNEYIKVLDGLMDTEDRQADLDQRQDALDSREFTDKELEPKDDGLNKPERLQKRIDNRQNAIDTIDEISDRWNEESPRYAGISDKEAAAIVKKWEADPRFSEMEKARDILAKINQKRLDILFESGELTQIEYDNYSNSYDHYVPLHRNVDDDTAPSTGSVTGPTGKPMKVAKGSMKEVVHIVAHSLENLQQAITRKHKAAAGKALYNFVLENPDAGITIEEREKVPHHDKEGNIRMHEKMQVNKNQLEIKVDGDLHLLTFPLNDKTAMRFLESINESAPNLEGPMKAIGKVTRFLASINTMYSPEFLISNFSRDIQTAMANMEDSEARGMQKKVIKGVFPAIKGILQAEYGNDNTYWGRVYRDYAKHGSKIGWMQSYDEIEDAAKDFESEMNLYKDGHVPKKALRKVTDLISHSNMAIENGVRLSTYDQLVKAGVSKSKAALEVSNLTVDFTRRGAKGPAINALYMFFNAGIQGNLRVVKAITRSNKVKAITGGIIGTGFAMQMLAYMAGDDEDSGIPYIDMIPDFVKERNIVFMKKGLDKDGNKNYGTIPMPYFYNMFYNMGTEIARAMYHRENGPKYKPAEGAMRMLNVAMGTLNPFQSASLAQAISPTIVDPLMMVAENKTWSGNKLMPGQSPYGVETADAYRFWKSASPMSKSVAQNIHRLTGGKGKYDTTHGVDVSPETIDLMYDTFTGSAGRFAKNVFDATTAVATGEEIEPRNKPFVRKVLGRIDTARAVSNEYYEQVKEIAAFEKNMKLAEGAERVEFAKDPLRRFVTYTKATEKRLKKLSKTIKQFDKRVAVNEETGRDVEQINATIDKLKERKTEIQSNYIKRLREGLKDV